MFIFGALEGLFNTTAFYSPFSYMILNSRDVLLLAVGLEDDGTLRAGNPLAV